MSRIESVSPVAGKHMSFADFHEDVLEREGTKVMSLDSFGGPSKSYRKTKRLMTRLQKDCNKTLEEKRQKEEV